MAWLFIEAHDATPPPSADMRLLGVALHWIEAVTGPLQPAVADCVSSEAPAEFAPC